MSATHLCKCSQQDFKLNVTFQGAKHPWEFSCLSYATEMGFSIWGVLSTIMTLLESLDFLAFTQPELKQTDGEDIVLWCGKLSKEAGWLLDSQMLQ